LASNQKPSSSGPRWRKDRTAFSKSARHVHMSASIARYPAIPHISASCEPLSSDPYHCKKSIASADHTSAMTFEEGCGRPHILAPSLVGAIQSSSLILCLSQYRAGVRPSGFFDIVVAAWRPQQRFKFKYSWQSLPLNRIGAITAAARSSTYSDSVLRVRAVQSRDRGGGIRTSGVSRPSHLCQARCPVWATCSYACGNMKGRSRKDRPFGDLARCIIRNGRTLQTPPA
jgi:hypothetical protein